MNYEQMIKEAYAYGASIALQEAGYEKTAADDSAVKLANLGGAGAKIDDLIAWLSQNIKQPVKDFGRKQTLKAKANLSPDAMYGSQGIEGGDLKKLIGMSGIEPRMGHLPRWAQNNPYTAMGAGALGGGALGAGAGVGASQLMD